MIPALIVPYISRPDLLRRLFDSGDGIEQALVINQSNCTVMPELPVYAKEIRCNQVGYAGAVNMGIGQTPRCPWWLIASVDVTFAPYDLAWIAERLDTATGPLLVTGDRSDDRLLRFAYFALNTECIDVVGLLDEWTFFPAYFEDDDYERRCHLGGVEWVTYNGSITHERSVTIADSTYAEKNGGTFLANRQAYVKKWGGLPGSETFVSPWGEGCLSLTHPSLRGRAGRLWE
jgi:hypothetical protein